MKLTILTRVMAILVVKMITTYIIFRRKKQISFAENRYHSINSRNEGGEFLEMIFS
jgi:hypothetical protein